MEGFSEEFKKVMEEFKKEKEEVIVPESEIPMAEEVIVISEEEKGEEEENSMDDYMSKYVADHELEEIVTLPNEDVLENIMLVENLFNEWSDEDLETPKNVSIVFYLEIIFYDVKIIK